MKKINRPLLIRFIIILIVTAVGVTFTSHKGKNLKSTDEFVKELKSKKYTVENVEDIVDRRHSLFSGNHKSIKAANVGLEVYEFNNEQEAINEAGKISEDGFSVTSPSFEDKDGNKPYYVAYLDWGDNPHFYLSGNLIVIYSGTNLKVQYDLNRILGSQIAGFKWYRPSRKQLISISDLWNRK